MKPGFFAGLIIITIITTIIISFSSFFTREAFEQHMLADLMQVSCHPSLIGNDSPFTPYIQVNSSGWKK